MQSDPTRHTSRVLLIEDSPGDARLIEEMLREGPFEIVWASSLGEGLREASERAPDVVLLDLSLPDSHGLETFERVDAEVVEVPTVILSGFSDGSLAQEAVRRGAQDYLVKGDITERGLQRALLYSIERHRFERERLALERDLAQSRKLEAVGQLAAGIAHEVNTPTQYVADNARFLRDAMSDLVAVLERLQAFAREDRPVPVSELHEILQDAEADYLVTEIPRAIDQSLGGLNHVSRIVRAMKEFSHPASEEKTPTDLNRSLETTIVVATNEWKYVADVETDLDPELPAVACLPGEMNQVFLNLIVNAAHAIAEVVDAAAGDRGTITVSTRALPGDLVEIRVSDTGAGIAPEHRDRIFHPFFTTKEVGKGTGQGLSIAHNVVVQKHGGTIDFETAVGRGTTFVLRLPVQPVVEAQPAGEVCGT